MRKTSSDRPVRFFSPSPTFRLATGVLVIGVVLLGSEAWRKPDWLLAVFAGGAAIVAIFMGLASLSRASFDGRLLTYRTPLRGGHQIDRGQIASVEMGGRRFRALVIGYHPRGANGLVETAQTKYINLAPLEDQDELFELLDGATEDAG